MYIYIYSIIIICHSPASRHPIIADEKEKTSGS